MPGRRACPPGFAHLEEHPRRVLVEAFPLVAQQNRGGVAAADVDAAHGPLELQQLAVHEQRGLAGVGDRSISTTSLDAVTMARECSVWGASGTATRPAKPGDTSGPPAESA